MADKLRKTSGWVLWIPCVLGALLLLISFYLNSTNLKNLSKPDIEGLKASVDAYAGRVGQWHDGIIGSLVALAEQREVREGVAKLGSGSVSPAWRQGFQEAMDATLRSMRGIHAGLENLTLRNVKGVKLAGSGAEKDSILYPDIQLRFSRQRSANGSDKLRERWIVPVRNPQARPLAYLIAVVNLAGSKRATLPDGAKEGDLVCLEDSSGARIWDSDAEIRIPDLGSLNDEFVLGGQKYYLARSTVSDLCWTVGVARDATIMSPDTSGLIVRSAIFTVLGIVLLVAVSGVVARRLG